MITNIGNAFLSPKSIARRRKLSLNQYDPHALDYFNRAEELGGSFDLANWNLVTNGGFDVDSSWSKGVNWTISGGVASHATTADDNLYQNTVLTLGVEYEITFDIVSLSTGYVRLYCGYASYQDFTTTGTKTATLTCAGDAILYFRMYSDGAIDNVSVKRTSYSSYTESYVKSAINDFIVTCKLNGTWEKLTEVYLLTGVTFGGLMAKLKYDSVATLTNNGFVSGDYLAAGSGAGLKGDGSSYLEGTLTGSFTTGDDEAMSIYITALSSGTYDSYISMSGGYDNDITSWSTAADLRYRIMNRPVDRASYSTGYHIVRGGPANMSAWQNGDSQLTAAISSAYTSSGELTLFARSGGSSFNDGTLSFAHAGLGLSDTEATDISDAVNTLMTALGCGVIA